MRAEEVSFIDSENVKIHYYKWSPENIENFKAIIQISHGMAEVSERYDRFAQALTSEGYIVYANDHRGHGKTAGKIENVGYLGDHDGFLWMVKDMQELSTIAKNENIGLPLFLFGHSMGSFLCQRYIQLYGKEIDGVILSGTNGKQGLKLYLGLLIAKFEICKNGRKVKSETLNRMSFGSYNKSFKPFRTEFDWLSRDTSEVDKYIKNDFCGGIFTAGFFQDFFIGLKEIEKLSNMSKVPKNLPIYIFSGSKDPVGSDTKGVMKLVNAYKNLGIKDIKYKFYKEGRHEMLNEINRDEVTGDIINWLNSKGVILCQNI